MAQPTLHPSQTAAIAHIHTTSLTQQPQSLEMINHVLYMSNRLPAPETHSALLSAIRRTARVALHFHPDRPVTSSSESTSVTSSLLTSGIYKSQFQTGISNGGLTARPGGARDEWERNLFGGAYHSDGWEDLDGAWRALRPKYGALDILGVASDGPAPRFGSCYFVLKADVLERCTFTFGDGSAENTKWKGTMGQLDGILAGMLEDAFVRESAMGVHGEVRLGRDVEALVADPSFRGGEVGGEMEALAGKFGFPLRWHVGSEIRAAEVPDDFRGPTVPSLAERVAKGGVVTVKDVGDAVRELVRDPEAWKDRGEQGHVMQEMKWLWHVLVRYGRPFGSLPRESWRSVAPDLETTRGKKKYWDGRVGE
ncbi:hypothetical protein QBC34DRAFT_493806 [Podospora aff. communis PSN243]|uniref:DUF3626 domain-containing protein n=1 Tax=Podospora aff. communis PSN243 TaxID=3040156 RepID=A0AAV9GSM5_9PEZI|nr:hypothetical protein QBC34DRAFT_493806 [Podospora aff. communis PSN243]